jgi:hypothetical protein
MHGSVSEKTDMGMANGLAAEKQAAPKHSATLRDEDFAQLLDAIEADHDRPGPPPLAVGAFDTPGIPDSPVTAYLALDPATIAAPVPGRHSVGYSSAAAAFDPMDPLPLGVDPEDALLVSALHAHEHGVPAHTEADMDEELNHLLTELNA